MELPAGTAPALTFFRAFIPVNRTACGAPFITLFAPIKKRYKKYMEILSRGKPLYSAWPAADCAEVAVREPGRIFL